MPDIKPVASVAGAGVSFTSGSEGSTQNAGAAPAAEGSGYQAKIPGLETLVSGGLLSEVRGDNITGLLSALAQRIATGDWDALRAMAYLARTGRADPVRSPARQALCKLDLIGFIDHAQYDAHRDLLLKLHHLAGSDEKGDSWRREHIEPRLARVAANNFPFFVRAVSAGVTGILSHERVEAGLRGQLVKNPTAFEGESPATARLIEMLHGKNAQAFQTEFYHSDAGKIVTQAWREGIVKRNPPAIKDSALYCWAFGESGRRLHWPGMEAYWNEAQSHFNDADNEVRRAVGRTMIQVMVGEVASPLSRLKPPQAAQLMFETWLPSRGETRSLQSPEWMALRGLLGQGVRPSTLAAISRVGKNLSGLESASLREWVDLSEKYENEAARRLLLEAPLDTWQKTLGESDGPIFVARHFDHLTEIKMTAATRFSLARSVAVWGECRSFEGEAQSATAVAIQVIRFIAGAPGVPQEVRVEARNFLRQFTQRTRGMSNGVSEWGDRELNRLVQRFRRGGQRGGISLDRETRGFLANPTHNGLRMGAGTFLYQATAGQFLFGRDFSNWENVKTVLADSLVYMPAAGALANVVLSATRLNPGLKFVGHFAHTALTFGIHRLIKGDRPTSAKEWVEAGAGILIGGVLEAAAAKAFGITGATFVQAMQAPAIRDRVKYVVGGVVASAIGNAGGDLVALAEGALA